MVRDLRKLELEQVGRTGSVSHAFLGVSFSPLSYAKRHDVVHTDTHFEKQVATDFVGDWNKQLILVILVILGLPKLILRPRGTTPVPIVVIVEIVVIVVIVNERGDVDRLRIPVLNRHPPYALLAAT